MVILHFFYAVCQREQTVRLPELNTKVQGEETDRSAFTSRSVGCTAATRFGSLTRTVVKS